MRNILKVFLVCLIFIYSFKGKACAYIDSGSGSYIFQFGIAFLMGGLFAIKIFWKKIKAYLIRVFLIKRKIKKDKNG